MSILTEGVDEEEEAEADDGEGGNGGVLFGNEMVSVSSGVVASGGAFDTNEGFMAGLIVL